MKLLRHIPLIVAVLGMLSVAQAADGPKFEKTYEAALERAVKENKPVVVIFSASWCPPCQRMKKEVYPSRVVQPFHDKFVWVYLDIDLEANGKLARQFGVRGIPHIEILAPDRKRLDRMVGGRPAPDFAAALEAALKKMGS